MSRLTWANWRRARDRHRSCDRDAHRRRRSAGLEGLAGKALFTEQEAGAYLKKRTDQVLAQPKNDIHYDDAIWQTEHYTKEPNRRTSLIVDPPDGKLPSETPEARKRAAEMGRARESADSA